MGAQAPDLGGRQVSLLLDTRIRPETNAKQRPAGNPAGRRRKRGRYTLERYPMIINTGLRTDIPAFYTPWLLDRLRD